MASRTYLPKLLDIILLVCKYMLRWEVQIKNALGGGSAEAAFDAVLTACQAFVVILEGIIPPHT